MFTRSLSLRIGIAACLSVSCGIGPFSNKNSDSSKSNTGDGQKGAEDGGKNPQSPKMMLLVNRKASGSPSARLHMTSNHHESLPLPGVDQKSTLLENDRDQLALDEGGLKATDKITITSALFSISAVKVKKKCRKNRRRGGRRRR